MFNLIFKFVSGNIANHGSCTVEEEYVLLIFFLNVHLVLLSYANRTVLKKYC